MAVALPWVTGGRFSVVAAGPAFQQAARAVAGALGLAFGGAAPALVVGAMPALSAAARRGLLQASLPEPHTLEPEWLPHGLAQGRRFAWPLGVEAGSQPIVHGVACAVGAPPAACRPLLAALGAHRLLPRQLGWFPVHRMAWEAALAAPG